MEQLIPNVTLSITSKLFFLFFTPLNTAAERYKMNTENTGLSILNHLKNFTNEVLVSCCETKYLDILQ